MGFDLNVSIPAVAVFLQGILSFFSPCVLPIIPLYMSYLSGGSTGTDENGFPIYNQKRILMNTLFFIVGVSFAFFLLGLSVSALGQFFTQNQLIFSRIGGILIVFFGLMQLGLFDKPFHGREFKLPIQIDVVKMNPFTALLMGFTFSFAWTPCVGPALSTVLIMISSASSQATGVLLMGVYTLGFTLPFLIVGLFTTRCLKFFSTHANIVKYTVKVGAAIMILMGLMMFTGSMNGVTSYLSSLGTNVSYEETTEEESASDEETTEEESISDEETAEEESEVVPAPDFELLDQYGNVHTLADYEGKVIFLNFWATWCYYCVKEMPDIQALYESYGYNEEDVIVLGVAMPNDENNSSSEGSVAYVTEFLDENGWTYPTLMDMDGSLASEYWISSYPTTFMIDADGNIYGYVSGMLSYDIMESIVEQTKGE